MTPFLASNEPNFVGIWGGGGTHGDRIGRTRVRVGLGFQGLGLFVYPVSPIARVIQLVDVCMCFCDVAEELDGWRLLSTVVWYGRSRGVRGGRDGLIKMDEYREEEEGVLSYCEWGESHHVLL